MALLCCFHNAILKAILARNYKFLFQNRESNILRDLHNIKKTSPGQHVELTQKLAERQ